jgi:rhodanese-related sulfurtransferase
MDEGNESSVPSVTAGDVMKAMNAKETFTLLDVRTPEEYARAKIEGSINVPVDTVEDTIEKIIPDKTQKIFVYCLSGSRSVYAVAVMMKLGYTNIFDLSHGLMAWRVFRFPVV